jgi:uncharacterized membrane protein (TIGR02234 family)
VSDPARRARGELWLALLLVLVGAGLAYLAAGRQWVDVTVASRPPLPPVERDLTGAQVVSALRPLSFVGLAGLAAMAATRGRGRVLVGALLAAAGIGVVVATLAGLSAGVFDALSHHPQPGATAPTGPEPGFTPWWVLAVVGGLVLMGGGLVIAVRGRRWSALSSRYDNPATRAQKPPPLPHVAAWDALDRGEDPTSRAPVDPTEPGHPHPGPDVGAARPRLDG